MPIPYPSRASDGGTALRFQIFLLDGARVARAYQVECDSVGEAIRSVADNADGHCAEIWQGPVRVWTRPPRQADGKAS